MLEQTEQGRHAMAEIIEKQRKARIVHSSGPMSPEQQSAAAAVIGQEANADAQAEQGSGDGRKPETVHKGSVPEQPAMSPMSPHEMRAADYQRGPLTEGHAAYARGYEPAQSPRPAAPTVTGKGPIADTVLSHGGRQYQRPDPRPS